MDSTATIIGYLLFALSEILPLINIPTNGILHTLIIGLGKSFKPPQKDIEMAHNCVEKHEFANIVNTINLNPQMKILVDSLINDPRLANTIQELLGNTVLSKQLNTLVNNKELQNVVNTLVTDPIFCNNISNLTPDLIELVKSPQKLKFLQEISPQDLNIITSINSINPTEKQNILDIINILNSHPDIIPNITNLVNQAIV